MHRPNLAALVVVASSPCAANVGSAMSEARTRTEQLALLRKRIAESGLSARQFAMQILLRDERTVRRWLAGDSPIPSPVVEFLERRE